MILTNLIPHNLRILSLKILVLADSFFVVWFFLKFLCKLSTFNFSPILSPTFIIWTNLNRHNLHMSKVSVSEAEIFFLIMNISTYFFLKFSSLLIGRGPSFEQNWDTLLNDAFAKLGWNWSSSYWEKEEHTKSLRRTKNSRKTDNGHVFIRKGCLSLWHWTITSFVHKLLWNLCKETIICI